MTTRPPCEPPREERFGIAAACYFAPERRKHISEWAAEVGPAAQAISKEMGENGLAYYHVAEQMMVEEMAERALERLFATSDLQASEVDMLIFCHSITLSVPPAPRSLPMRLMRRFGMTRARGLSIAQQKCASVFGALRLLPAWAHGLGSLENVVIVSADKTHEEPGRNIGTYAISSDGSMAMWLRRRHASNVVGPVVQRAEAAYYKGVEKGEKLQRRFSLNYPIVAHAVLTELMKRQQWSIGDVSGLLPMNINVQMLRKIALLLGLPVDRLYTDNVARIGHCGCADPFINLIDRFPKSDMSPRPKALLYASGSAGCFAALAIGEIAGF